MGIYEFNQLELEEQKKLVWIDAIFLTNRI
jgi:hypothetical protein